MAIPQEVLDYIHNRVELKIHKIQITLGRLVYSPCSFSVPLPILPHSGAIAP